MFTRSTKRATYWSANDFSNGGWTSWQKLNLTIAPENDPIAWLPINNATIEPLNGNSGVNSSANPLKMAEDQVVEFSFRSFESYGSVEAVTESFTYLNDLTKGLCLPGSNAQDCLFLKQEWQASKMAVSVDPMPAPAPSAAPSGPSPSPSASPAGPSPTPAPPNKWPDGTTQLRDSTTLTQFKQFSKLFQWNLSGNSWSQSDGSNWGPPATAPTANSNITCKPSGSCVLRFQTPKDFFGPLELFVKLADGSDTPQPADYSAEKELSINVENSPDPKQALPVVIDMFEDAPMQLRFMRAIPKITNCGTSHSLTLLKGGKQEIRADWNWTTNEPMFSEDNPIYGRLIGGQRYAPCQIREIEKLTGFAHFAGLGVFSYIDPDKENLTTFEVSDITGPITVSNPVIDNAKMSSALVTITAPNVDNVLSSNASGTPYTYKNNASLGDWGFKYRFKTWPQTDDFFSNKAQVHVRVHPVNDPLIVSPSVTLSNCSIHPDNDLVPAGSKSKQCVKKIEAFEDELITLEITKDLYKDPDADQNPARPARFSNAIGIHRCFNNKLSSENGTEYGTDKQIGAAADYTLPDSDNDAFVWSPAFSYQTEYETTVANGRTDPFADPASILLSDAAGVAANAIRRSTGKLLTASSNPVIQWLQVGSKGSKSGPFKENSKATANAVPDEYPDFSAPPGTTLGAELRSGCDYDPATQWTTGTCRMQLLPSPNVNGKYVVCVQLADGVGPGEFFRNQLVEDALLNQPASDRFYVEIDVKPRPDAPRVSQLALRARANEDNAAEFVVGPTKVTVKNNWIPKALVKSATQPATAKNPTTTKMALDKKTSPIYDQNMFGGGGSFKGSDLSTPLPMENLAGTVLPGYWDIDGDGAQELVFETSASAGFTGLMSGSLLFPSNPNENANDPNFYDGECTISSPSDGICKVPCDTQGWCRFKIVNSENANSRIRLKYYVNGNKKNDAGQSFVLPSLQSATQDNPVSPPQTPAWPALWKNAAERSFFYNNATLGCLPETYDTDDWRLTTEETGFAGGMPGKYSDPLLDTRFGNGIGNPAYPQLTQPSNARPLPVLKHFKDFALGLERQITLKKWGNTANYEPATRVLEDPASSTNFPTILCVPKATLEYTSEMGFWVMEGSVVDLQKGAIVADFSAVPDKPFTRIVARSVGEDSGKNELFLGNSNDQASTTNGYLDGDGDPIKYVFFHNDLPDSVGTLTTSETPPASPIGLDLPVYNLNFNGDAVNAKGFGPTNSATAAGCLNSTKRCRMYFYPAPNFSGEYTLKYSVVTGSDDWYSGSLPSELGELRLVVNGINDSPTLSFVPTAPSAIVTGSSPVTSDFQFYVTEGAPDEGPQSLTMTATSSDPSKVQVQLLNEAGTANWADTGANGSIAGVLRIIAPAFYSNNVSIQITLSDSGGATQTFNFPVTLAAPNTAPVVVFDNNFGAPYRISEGNGSGQQAIRLDVAGSSGPPAEVLVDEGAGDSNFQNIQISFSSSDPLAIPNNAITFSRTDTIGDYDLGAANGNILITPAADYASLPGSFVTISMLVTETNVTPALSYSTSFKVFVEPSNDAPTVAPSLTAVGTYTGQEDQDLVIGGVTIDEGGGADENAQIVVVSFESYDTTLIDTITFNRTDSSILDFGAAAGTITVKPKPNAFGSSSVTLRAEDGVGGATTATFTVQFNALNDPPLIVSGLPTSASTNEDTPLGLSNIVIDEGGQLSGTFSEDSEGLTLSFTSSNTQVVASSGIVGSWATEPSGQTASAHTFPLTLTITPVTNASGTTTITIKASDDGHSQLTIGTLSLTVIPQPDAPVGQVSCNPTNSAGLAVNNFVAKPGLNLSLLGITCSGISDPDGEVVAYQVTGTCAPSMSINPATGAITGSMPAASCSLQVSATGGSDEISSGQKKNLNFAVGKIESASLSNVQLSNDNQCQVSATASAIYDGASYASSTASAAPSLFTSLSASSNSWTGVLSDFFTASSTTLKWEVKSNASDALEATKSIGIVLAALPLSVEQPAAEFSQTGGAGQQLNFAIPTSSCSTASQCTTDKKAVVAAGMNSSCVAKKDGALACFGSNAFGKLGMNTATALSNTAVDISLPGTVMSIAIGDNHTCAVNSLGALYCWGSNAYGQLGINSTTTTQTSVPQLVLGPSLTAPYNQNIVSVTAGSFHTCALSQNGKVYCFGRNNSGQLGNASTIDSDTPVEAITQKAVSLAAAGGHTCAIVRDPLPNPAQGQILCWGDNATDQLGIGAANPNSTSPTSVLAIASFHPAQVLEARALVAGGAPNGSVYKGHTCAVFSSNKLYCWGANNAGQLGASETFAGAATNGAGYFAKTKISGVDTDLDQVVSAAAGAEFTCALHANQSISCFGANASSQLGYTGASSFFAVSLGTTVRAHSLAAGSEHLCFTEVKGTTRCIGAGGTGQLGNQASENSANAVNVKTQSGTNLETAGQRCYGVTIEVN